MILPRRPYGADCNSTTIVIFSAASLSGGKSDVLRNRKHFESNVTTCPRLWGALVVDP